MPVRLGLIGQDANAASEMEEAAEGVPPAVFALWSSSSLSWWSSTLAAVLVRKNPALEAGCINHAA
jgi:hypothetical protein